jgi:hypothetical protein
VVDLLASHHRAGRRFEATELVEEGSRVAVRLTVTDPAGPGSGEAYKVFTFRAGGDVAVLLEDCVDRGDALTKLARP